MPHVREPYKVLHERAAKLLHPLKKKTHHSDPIFIETRKKMQQMQKVNGKRCDNESAQTEKSEDFHRKLWQFFKSIAAIAVS